MTTILMILIALMLANIAGKLDDISHKLDRPVLGAGQYVPRLEMSR